MNINWKLGHDCSKHRQQNIQGSITTNLNRKLKTPKSADQSIFTTNDLPPLQQPTKHTDDKSRNTNVNPVRQTKCFDLNKQTAQVQGQSIKLYKTVTKTTKPCLKILTKYINT